ncbi:hypothetical protein BG004_007241 [Podila humilis]|nr:hypothetical protein BG004_007241 [Podila humilis]
MYTARHRNVTIKNVSNSNSNSNNSSLLGIAIYCFSSIVLSAMIANATGPVMDVTHFVKPTTTTSSISSSSSFSLPSMPTPIAVQDPLHSSLPYLDMVANALSSTIRSPSRVWRRMAGRIWIAKTKTKTPSSKTTTTQQALEEELQQRPPYRGGPYSPRADYLGIPQDESPMSMQNYNKSGFCDTKRTRRDHDNVRARDQDQILDQDLAKAQTEENPGKKLNRLLDKVIAPIAKP